MRTFGFHAAFLFAMSVGFRLAGEGGLTGEQFLAAVPDLL
jgi:hypothetical protein